MNAVEILKSVSYYLITIDSNEKQKSDEMGIKIAKEILKLIEKS